ncbi:hypothetical protein [uncultured Corynebacterium sp.]|uniref:hypothetical protein n=1 Tax=uncultured Corynebacterium sp. TaxID=159447 RepID=UPI002804CD0F|nr:hypothetical protein [uncultured Corynebacterium sp.]
MKRWLQRIAAKRLIPTDRQRALNMIMIPIGIGQTLAAAESLSIRNLYRPNDLLRGISSENVSLGTIKYKIFRLLDSPKTPTIVATLNLFGAAALIFGSGNRKNQIVGSSIIAIGNRLNEIRTPYGRDGADQMTSVITQYRLLTAFIPDANRSDEVFLRAVNIQAWMSYFVSGVSKLFGPSWLRGTALSQVLETQSYGNGPLACKLKERPRLMRIITLFTPVWEVSFPLIYMLPVPHSRLALDAVKVFHLGIAAVMELPRFFWGFSAAHGAIQYVSDRKANGQKTIDTFEQSVFVAILCSMIASVVYGAQQRQIDIERRKGIKGTSLLELEDGSVEYHWRKPTLNYVNPDTAPIVILESGLGNALEAWEWVSETISNQCHVLSYHRPGYARTTSKASSKKVLNKLVENVGSQGPIIAVSHSIGFLCMNDYVDQEIGGRRISAAVIVDGTDPLLLEADRKDSEGLGRFLQSQAQSMFVSISGIYNYVPNVVDSQSAFTPDTQRATIQFAYSPRNIYQSTKEYFTVSTENIYENFSRIPAIRLIASEENEKQQRELASKIGSDFSTIPDSSHRSILGHRKFAVQVADVITEVVEECLGH